jgi:hypothetical protein
MLKIVAILALILTFGCGKEANQDTDSSARFALPLEGLATEEILNLKYNNVVNLRCSVRTNLGNQINLGSKPIDEIIINIPGKTSSIHFLNYRFNNKDMVVTLMLGGKLRIIPRNNYIAENRREYYMENSPAAKLLFRWDLKSRLTNGQIDQALPLKSRTLYENIEERLHTMSNNREVMDLRCMLQTTLNPAYSRQWQIIR